MTTKSQPYTEREAVRLVKRAMSLIDQIDVRMAALQAIGEQVIRAAKGQEELLKVLRARDDTPLQH